MMRSLPLRRSSFLMVKGGARRIGYLGNDTGTYQSVRADALTALKDADLAPVNVVEGDPASDPTYSAAAAKAARRPSTSTSREYCANG